MDATEEIKQIIDGMIEECRKRRMIICREKAVFSDDPDWLCEVGYKQALIELKTKLGV